MLRHFRNPDLGVLLLRLAVGAVFIYHGWGKLTNLNQTGQFFVSLGMNQAMAAVVAIIELAGGLAIVLGAITYLASLILALIMAGAIYLVKWPHGFAGYEFELTLLVACLTIFFTGPGKYSFILKRNK